jgi:hypothetical protein
VEEGAEAAIRRGTAQGRRPSMVAALVVAGQARREATVAARLLPVPAPGRTAVESTKPDCQRRRGGAFLVLIVPSSLPSTPQKHECRPPCSGEESMHDREYRQGGSSHATAAQPMLELVAPSEGLLKPT